MYLVGRAGFKMNNLKDMMYNQIMRLLDERYDDNIEEVKNNIKEVTRALYFFDFKSDEKIKELLYKKLEIIVEKSGNEPADIREVLSLMQRVADEY